MTGDRKENPKMNEISQEKRDSNFELLRLVCMFFIVLYHLLLWFVQDNPSHLPLKALWLPLHVGVICFVLISGYFRIKPTSKGFIKLVSMVFVYSLPGMIVEIRNASGWHDVLHSLMFVSRTNYWFVRTYIGLYLVSPLINLFLDHATIKAKWYMVMATGIISVYLGNVSNYLLYADGKNLVNFLFLYQIRQMLSYYSGKWKNLGLLKLLVAYSLLNVLVVLGFYFFMGTKFSDLLWRLSFPYSSPILIINAVLLFVIFGHISFSSDVLNKWSAGIFAVYLIHGNYPLVTDIQRNMVSNVFSIVNDGSLFVGILVLMAFAVVLVCLLINRLLMPIWRVSDRFAGYVYNKLGF